MQISLSELADLVGGTIVKGRGDQALGGFAAVDEASPDDLTFFGNERYLGALKASRAGAVLVPVGFAHELPRVAGIIEVQSPSGAFAEVVRRFGVPERPFVPGIHPTAVVDPAARLDPAKVSIGAHVVIEAGCEIGEGTTIGHNSVVGRGCRIGRDCLIHPNVTVRDGTIIGHRVILQSGCVIGADGFGYEFRDGRYEKVEQVGIVQLDDDVEIGACATVDRARFGRTWVRQGTKIDNLVMIAHNCVIGKHVAVAAQTGFSGSVRTGDYVVAGGQVGVQGHVEIGDRVVMTARAGVTKSLEAPGYYIGFPATPRARGRRILAAQQSLPELVQRIRRLEKALGMAGRDRPADEAGDGNAADGDGTA